MIYGNYLNEHINTEIGIEELCEQIFVELDQFYNLIELEESISDIIKTFIEKFIEIVSNITTKITSIINKIKIKLKNRSYIQNKCIQIINQKYNSDIKEANNNITLDSYLNDIKIDIIEYGKLTTELMNEVYINGDNININNNYIDIDTYIERRFKKNVSISTIEFIRKYGNEDVWMPKFNKILSNIDNNLRKLRIASQEFRKLLYKDSHSENDIVNIFNKIFKLPKEYADEKALNNITKTRHNMITLNTEVLRSINHYCDTLTYCSTSITRYLVDSNKYDADILINMIKNNDTMYKYYNAAKRL